MSTSDGSDLARKHEEGSGMADVEFSQDVTALTVQLLSVYLANNTVAPSDLAGLIQSTRNALGAEQAAALPAEPEAVTPAVSVRKSLASPDHILSLIDGKPYKTLKRHLMGHGLTPDAYRSRYGLPASYPMVAPAYAERRRGIAQKNGLGVRKTAATKTASSKDDQVDLGRVDEAQKAALTPKAGPLSLQQGRKRARVERGTGAAASDIAEEGASDASVTNSSSAAGANSPAETSSSASAENSQGAAALGTKKRNTPARQKRSAKASSEAPATRRGKAKAQSLEPAQTTAGNSPASSSAAEDAGVGASATKPKRRTKLGLFKNSRLGEDADGVAPGVEEANDMSPRQEVECASATTLASIPRKRTRRMARQVAELAQAQPNEPAPDGDTPAK